MIAWVTGTHTLASTLQTSDPPIHRKSLVPGQWIIRRESVFLLGLELFSCFVGQLQHFPIMPCYIDLFGFPDLM